MKCLSIQQPWAEMIVAGYKNVENRKWPTEYRGPILIHLKKESARAPASTRAKTR